MNIKKRIKETALRNKGLAKQEIAEIVINEYKAKEFPTESELELCIAVVNERLQYYGREINA